MRKISINSGGHGVYNTLSKGCNTFVYDYNTGDLIENIKEINFDCLKPTCIWTASMILYGVPFDLNRQKVVSISFGSDGMEYIEQVEIAINFDKYFCPNKERPQIEGAL